MPAAPPVYNQFRPVLGHIDTVRASPRVPADEPSNNRFHNNPEPSPLSSLASPSAHTHALTVATTIPTAYNNKDNDEFAQMMRDRTKQKREKQDTALAHLRVQVRHLEAALAAETRRRCQAVATVQAAAAAAVATVADQWKLQYQDDQAETNQRMNVLEARIQELERQWQGDVRRMQSVVHSSAEQCQTTLASLQEQMDVDNKTRLQREGQVMQQLHDLGDEYASRWKTERQDRVQALHELTQRVELQENVRDAQVDALARRFQEALEDLSSALEVERQERSVEDMALVAAQNRFTAKVQSSLTFMADI
jgi:hypothetical protein